ncbi:MAG: Abi family protein [Clostridia bacterium]|nr:Abi family protein [Clostridia bacterium]
MRNIVFKCIEKIEYYLRSQIAYYCGHKYGPLGYLDKNNFSSKHDHSYFISKVESSIESQRQTHVVRHHIRKYNGQFPIWVAIDFFSMGVISFFYSDLDTPDRKNIVTAMYGSLSDTCLSSWLRCLTDLRNRCAHFSRLYYWRFTSIPRTSPEISSLQPKDRSLFAQILILKRLYPEPDKWNEEPFVELEKLVDEYVGDISLKHIGFPVDWKDFLRQS